MNLLRKALKMLKLAMCKKMCPYLFKRLKYLPLFEKRGKKILQEETSAPVVEKPNSTVAKKKKTKMGPMVVTPIAETPKGRSRKKEVIPEETPIRRSPRLRGNFFKESTSSKPSTKESPVQIVPYHSPPHPEITNIPENPNEECRVEVNKNQNDTSTGQLGTSSCRDETVPEKFYPNTT